MGTRLNKYLALCGIESRRRADDLIAAGRVSINGRPVTKLGTTVEAGDRVELDRRPVAPFAKRIYLILNKPRGYVTTHRDERNRLTVMDLVPEKYRRHAVHPVGRLDRDTEGLLIITNDGDLSYRLTRPEYHVSKEYIADIDRPLADADRVRIGGGLYLHRLGIRTRPAMVETTDETGSRVRIIITEGKNRQVRETFRVCGYMVRRLERVSYGPLTTRRIRKGSLRPMTKYEIASLKKAAGMGND